MENNTFKIADKFIVVNDLVKDYIEDKVTSEKEIVVCYGNYSIMDKYYKFYKANKINYPKKSLNILYSGSIDKVRGVYDIINICDEIKDLNCNIYISGYGTEDEIVELKTKLREKKNNKIHFVGALEANKYYELLEESDICLNCQYDYNEFAKYSFPSKIINYLSFSKCVISTEMESIKKSKIGNLVNYYQSKDLKTLVNLIRRLVDEKEEINKYKEHINQEMKIIKDSTEIEIVELLRG